MYNKDLLKKGLEGFGIEIDGEAFSRLDVFSRLLTEKNRVMNLTRVTDPNGIAVKHFLDSIMILAACEIKTGAAVIDVGTGGGIPGIPLLIARPNLKMTFLDSTAKKLNFVDEALRELGLFGRILPERAEVAGRDKNFRESFDFVISRAVAPMIVLCEICLPFLVTGGEFLALKGPGVKDETGGVAAKLSLLSSRLDGFFSYTLPLPGGEGERNIVKIKKISDISPKYPRDYAKIIKEK